MSGIPSGLTLLHLERMTSINPITNRSYIIIYLLWMYTVYTITWHGHVEPPLRRLSYIACPWPPLRRLCSTIRPRIASNSLNFTLLPQVPGQHEVQRPCLWLRFGFREVGFKFVACSQSCSVASSEEAGEKWIAWNIQPRP